METGNQQESVDKARLKELAELAGRDLDSHAITKGIMEAIRPFGNGLDALRYAEELANIPSIREFLYFSRGHAFLVSGYASSSSDNWTEAISSVWVQTHGSGKGNDVAFMVADTYHESFSSAQNVYSRLTEKDARHRHREGINERTLKKLAALSKIDVVKQFASEINNVEFNWMYRQPRPPQKFQQQ